MLLENWYSFLCLTIENQGEAWTILEEKEKEFFSGRKTLQFLMLFDV